MQRHSTIIPAQHDDNGFTEKDSSINNKLAILSIYINPTIPMNQTIYMVQILHHLWKIMVTSPLWPASLVGAVHCETILSNWSVRFCCSWRIRVWNYPISARFRLNISSILFNTIKILMSSPKCRSVEVINNPARPGSNHREVNYINYK